MRLTPLRDQRPCFCGIICIFNSIMRPSADETALFFCQIPSKSLVVSGESTSGVKTLKNRVTLLLACSLKGEKLDPVFIGNSENPRCFRGSKLSSLGVVYYWNKKAWMTSKIFSDWLNRINNKFKLQSRRVLLFVDNCSAHGNIDLSNIKVQFLPKNTTSKLQPCDAGIIQNVKLNYRKMFLRHLISKLDNDRTATTQQVAKSITLLDAIIWIRVSWLRVQEDTITKCFRKCGFGQCDVTNSPEVIKFEDDMVDHPILTGVNVEEYTSTAMLMNKQV